MSVIKEIPVFLSKQFIENLLLFEFPSRPKASPIKPSSIVDCKYKPKFQYAELSLALDTKSANYEIHRGKELGQQAPDQFPRGQFDRQLLRSMPHAPGQRYQQQHQRCAIARFHDNRLTLCPMSAGARLMMQPVLEHLDAAAKTSDGPSASSEEAESAKTVTLRYARQETPEARQRREQSYRACQRLLEQESWLRCRWLADDDVQYDKDSFLFGVASGSEATTLVAMETDELLLEDSAAGGFKMVGDGDTSSSEHYLSRLCPPVSSVSAVDEHTASLADRGAPSVSLARLRAMPCDERLRALFKSACVLRWTQLVDLLKQCGMTRAQLTESLAQIHGHLTELACLVHGQWVVKSDILYPAGTVSMYSGVPAEVLCRGRDYILCRFVQGRTVTRKEVASLVKMPSEEISQILARISRIVRPTGDSGHQHHHHQQQQQKRAPKMRLAFVMDEDTEYIRRNPDVVKKARYYWDAKWKLLSEQLKLDKAARPFRAASMSLDSHSGTAHRSRTRSARYSTSSSEYHCRVGGEVVSDSSLSSSAGSSSSVRRSPSRRGRGGGGGGSRRRLYPRRQCVSMCEGADDGSADPVASHSGSPSPGPDQGRDAELAGLNVSPTDPSELELSVRTFLLTKLQDRMVAGLEELTRFYRAEATLTPASSAGVGDPATALPASEEACRKLFDAAADSAGLVILQGGGGCRLYAYTPPPGAGGETQTHARHRRELLAALKTGNAQVTLAQLRARFESAQLEPLSEAALKSLVRDYCVFRGKAYYAKGYQH